MVWVCVLSDLLIVTLLMIPVLNGVRKGFVKTVVKFGKTLLSFALACLFAKPLGVLLENKLLYDFISEKVAGLFETDRVKDSAELLAALPNDLKRFLLLCGLDVNAMAESAAIQSDRLVGRFTEALSEGIASTLGFTVAFIGIFLTAWLSIHFFGPLMDSLVGKIPVVKSFNKGLGALLGLLIGVMAAWVCARAIVSIGGFFFAIDFAKAYVLMFFYRASPLNWLLAFA